MNHYFEVVPRLHDQYAPALGVDLFAYANLASHIRLGELRGPAVAVLCAAVRMQGAGKLSSDRLEGELFHIADMHLRLSGEDALTEATGKRAIAQDMALSRIGQLSQKTGKALALFLAVDSRRKGFKLPDEKNAPDTADEHFIDFLVELPVRDTPRYFLWHEKNVLKIGQVACREVMFGPSRALEKPAPFIVDGKPLLAAPRAGYYADRPRKHHVPLFYRNIWHQPVV